MFWLKEDLLKHASLQQLSMKVGITLHNLGPQATRENILTLASMDG